MVYDAQGNIFDAPVDAMINPVNCVGIMGKGLALAVKNRYPESFAAYKTACQNKQVVPGRMFLTREADRLLIHFPTKRHWRDRSRLEDIRAGLVDLRRVIEQHKISSIAIPALGCGNGGLSWADVRPLIVVELKQCSTISILLFPPEAQRDLPRVSDLGLPNSWEL